MGRFEGGEAVHQVPAHPRRALRELFLKERGERGERYRGDERRPPERGRVGAGREPPGDGVARDHGADGDAVRQPLGERHDIRLHAPVLVPPERAGPPQACLDLVQDQERSGLVAELPQAGEIPVVGDVHAPLALDRLQQDCGGPVVQRSLHRPEVVVGHVLEPRHERLEAVTVLLLPGGGHRGEGAPVEGIPHRDDLVAIAREVLAAVSPGQLEGRLVGFGARVAEEDPVAERVLAEKPGEMGLGRRMKEVGHVDQRPRRLPDGSRDPRMAVPERYDADPGGEIQVLAPIGIPDADPLATDQADGGPGIRRNVVPLGPLEERLGVHGVPLRERFRFRSLPS